MIGTRKDIEKALVFSDDKQEYILFEIPLTSGQRTKVQNNTFHLCFDKISKKMGISKDEVKQNCLKALFGVSKSKFGGVEYENAIIGSTAQLNKEQAILLIETLIQFGESLGLGIILETREMRTLFE